MKERPINFRARMVRAILDGRKTQERRIVKPQPHQSEYEPDIISWPAVIKKRTVTPGGIVIPKGQPYFAISTIEEFAKGCPYGQPGDRLWVMPRWASRILLEIVSVRVERVQDISEEDAASEGAPCELGRLEGAILGAQASYRKGFIRLWESINGEGSWIENPWVWVIEFKRIHQQTEVSNKLYEDAVMSHEGDRCPAHDSGQGGEV